MAAPGRDGAQFPLTAIGADSSVGFGRIDCAMLSVARHAEDNPPASSRKPSRRVTARHPGRTRPGRTVGAACSIRDKYIGFEAGVNIAETPRSAGPFGTALD